jgi:hypothetical protein
MIQAVYRRGRGEEVNMKAHDYLELTERMMTAQADYYATSRKYGSKSKEAIAALIVSKELEKQVWVVIKSGKLESDAPSQSLRHLLTEEEYKEYERLINQHQIELQLDLFNDKRPDGKEGAI